MSKTKNVKSKATKSSAKTKSTKSMVAAVTAAFRASAQKSKVNSNTIRLKAATTTTDRGLSLVNAFRRALQNPFDPAICGVKLPEPFPSHTSTFKVAGSIQISAAAGVLSGGIYLRPNPFYSLLNTTNYVTNSTSGLTIGGSPVQSASSPSVYAATVPPGVMRNHRVVACGFKISVTQPGLNREGNMYVVPIPTGRDTPSYSVLNSQALSFSAAPSRLTDDVNGLVLNSSLMLEMPGAMRFSLTELGNSSVILCDRPTSYAYADFYPTSENSNINATLAESGDVVYATAGGTAIVGSSSSIPITLSPGHTSYALYFDQLPNAAQNIVNVEYIYHLEGSPNVTVTGSNPVMVPSGPEMPTGSTSWETVVSSVSKFGIGVVDVVNEYGPTIANMYKGYSGNSGSGNFKMVGY